MSRIGSYRHLFYNFQLLTLSLLHAHVLSFPINFVDRTNSQESIFTSEFTFQYFSNINLIEEKLEHGIEWKVHRLSDSQTSSFIYSFISHSVTLTYANLISSYSCCQDPSSWQYFPIRKRLFYSFPTFLRPSSYDDVVSPIVVQEIFNFALSSSTRGWQCVIIFFLSYVLL